MQGVLGTALGEPIVYTVDASWVLGVGFILALLAAALPQAGETVPLGHRTKAGVWGIVLCVIALSFVTALNWTPINYTTIFGLQGATGCPCCRWCWRWCTTTAPLPCKSPQSARRYLPCSA